MYLFGRELLRQEVQEAGTGRVIGRVSQVVWDPSSGRLVGLRIEDGPEVRLVERAEIQSIRPGVITILPGTEASHERAAVPLSEQSGLGKHLMTDDGQDLGMVDDVIFDAATSQVLGYEVLYGETTRVVPAIAPIHEYPDRIVLPARSARLAGSDLSVLAEVVDREGGVSFPISEEPGQP